MASKTTVAKVVMTLCQIYRVEQSEMMLEIWSTALDTVTDDQANHGLGRVIRERESGFIPTPGEFRKYCTLDAGVSNAEEAAVLAWGDLIRAVSSIGGYKSIMLKDQISAEVVRRVFGGWSRLCSTLEDKALPFEERRFKSAYSALWRSGASYSNLLVGICDGQNRELIESGEEVMELELVGYSESDQKEMSQIAYQEFIGGNPMAVIATAYKKRQQINSW